MKKGFTLIEMMIVVAIIAIIAAIAIPSLLAAQRTSNETSAVGTLRTYAACQVMYRKSNATYAATLPLLYNADPSLTLIAVDVNNAYGAAGVPKQGYLLTELTGIVDWTTDFGLLAYPKSYQRSGTRDFGVSSDATVYAADNAGAAAVARAALAGWQVAQ